VVVTAAALLARLRRGRRLASWLAPRAPQSCACGHDKDAHKHWRPGSDCGACGADLCDRFHPVDMPAVCRDAELIDAVLADDIDRALKIGPAELVGMLAALADTGRRA
jgi:hypothetical protein